jgi:hypothetical protein
VALLMVVGMPEPQARPFGEVMRAIWLRSPAVQRLWNLFNAYSNVATVLSWPLRWFTGQKDQQR